MVLSGIQILGLAFAAALFYLSYLFFRKKLFGKKDLLVWGTIGIIFAIIVVFPSTVTGIIEPFGVVRALDLLTIISTITSFAILFAVYARTAKTQKKVEQIVEKLALEKKKKN